MAYAPFGQFQGFADLLEGKAVVEVEGSDETFPILEPAYGLDELGTQIYKVRVRLGIDRRDVLDERTILYTRLPVDLQTCLERGHLGARVLIQEGVVFTDSDA